MKYYLEDVDKVLKELKTKKERFKPKRSRKKAKWKWKK